MSLLLWMSVLGSIWFWSFLACTAQCLELNMRCLQWLSFKGAGLKAQRIKGLEAAGYERIRVMKGSLPQFNVTGSEPEKDVEIVSSILIDGL